MNTKKVVNTKDVKKKKSLNTEGMSPFRLAMMRLRQNKLAMFGLTVLILLAIISILAPVIAPYERDLADMTKTYAKPSSAHLLGTDDLGRDVLTRLIYSGRISLTVGIFSALISLFIGSFVGATSGYFGGKIDFVNMRIVDIFMCFPFFVLAITIAAVLGPSIWNVVFITGVLGWTGIARIIRAEILSIKEREFVEAARALGMSSGEIIIKHILPNVAAPLIVFTTMSVAFGIISEAGLSFLGLGVKQPVPSWGNMLAAAQGLRQLRGMPWLWVPPGILVFVSVLSINFLGDGLRDALDPKLKR
ncbi:oligopeptide ABC transporter permease [Oceanirhabdus sp. W0125-5]|uniref:oligopeptide ABC transporter permease n=1 Tax=Oceanirhabdus sp. W0125-5 TaxID=2999116 RepID=UPI0022F2FF13|nr:oligopeptide ABC transporter permease [Oceanirhabdus sp. W0125-5]WBW95672.1 ABC transporter permease [Oceanirhabdus sp. W0125-5]